MINFSCQCGKSYSLDEQYAGKKVRCRECNSMLTVPNLIQKNESYTNIQKPITNRRAEADLVKRLILTTIGIVVFLVICFISFFLYRNNLDKKQQQQKVVEIINTSVENADKYASTYDYRRALQQIDDVVAQIDKNKYATSTNKKTLNDKRSEIAQSKTAFDKKIASGYIIFKGKLITAAEKEKITFENLIDKANQGDIKAQFTVAKCYENGQTVEQDFEEAFKWYTKAAEQGEVSSQYSLGVCYAYGIGVEQNDEEAVKWYIKAAEQGDANSQYNLGLYYNEGQVVEQNYKEAFRWYSKAAKQGKAEAQCNLGICYLNNLGTEQDYQQAVKWFSKAADQGFALAQYNMGVVYDNGYGVAQDYYEAFKWYSKAAQQGNVNAQHNLGSLYYNGTGVEQNYKEALKLYQKAAEQGNALSQCNLGVIYLQGQVVPQDIQRGYYWLQKSAEQGCDTAQQNIQNEKQIINEIHSAILSYFELKEPAEQAFQTALNNPNNEYILNKGQELNTRLRNAHDVMDNYRQTNRERFKIVVKEMLSSPDVSEEIKSGLRRYFSEEIQ